MEPRVEVGKFYDGRFKVLLRIAQGNNFKDEGNGEFTWCLNMRDIPTLKTLIHALIVLDQFNKDHRKELNELMVCDENLLLNTTS